MKFSRFILIPVVVASVSACSVPKPETLECVDGQSIFECKSKFTDGKLRSVTFVDTPLPDQPVLDSTTTKDDFGNPFCVTLYDNATAAYVPGECGSEPAETATTSTLSESAVAQTLECADGQSAYTCQAQFTDGTVRALSFVDSPPTDIAALESVLTTDDFGNAFCVTLYANASATFKPGQC